MSKLKIKEVFRYGREKSYLIKTIDGFPNHFHITNLKEHKLVLLERGINPIATVNLKSLSRKPAILIRSSPHKIGSEGTPWQDVFDVDNGHIRYYGDNKTPGRDPAKAPGNKLLLEAFNTYMDVEKRHSSVPLIFYKAVNRNNKTKGYVEFNGFGIIKGVELIAQYDRAADRTFSNYAFNFHVFSLAGDNEEFNWDWINDRRDRQQTLEQTLRNAPKSWKDWIKHGNAVPG